MSAEQIPGVSGSSGVDAQPVSRSHTNDPFLYNTNYILLVMKYTNVAMEHQANLVAMQGQLENVVTQIQGCLSTISEFFSQLEGNSASGGCWEKSGNYSPNSNNGLNSNFYHMNENQYTSGTFGSDNQGSVSASYQGDMRSFINAMNMLFNYSSSGTGPTLAQVQNIAIPGQSGSGFNMDSYYASLENGGFSAYNPLSPVVSEASGVNPGVHVSLLQQYMYYQAQLTVNADPISQVEAAFNNPNGLGIANLVDFDPTSQGGCDPNILALTNILNDLNTTVVTGRTSDDNSFYVNNTTQNLLSMIYEATQVPDPVDNPNSILYNQNAGENPYTKMDEFNPGLFAAFSYAAFNYIWTKNPTMSTAQSASNDINRPAGGGWKWDTTHGSTGNGDMLSNAYSDTSSTQTSLSSSGSQANSQFQEQVNGVQQMQNVAQNMISGWASSMTSVVGNWKSA